MNFVVVFAFFLNFVLTFVFIQQPFYAKCVVNGKIADYVEYGYVAAIHEVQESFNCDNYDSFYDVQPICTGTILDEKSIITSASCVDGRNFSSMIVTVGGVNLREMKYCHHVDTVNVHPRFNHSKNCYNGGNLAIIKLKSIVKLTSLEDPDLRAVELAPKLVNYYYNCKVLGWGKAVKGKSFSHELKYQEVKSSILETFGPSPHAVAPELIRLWQESTCTIDSGGPLICSVKGMDGEFLIGIAADNQTRKSSKCPKQPFYTNFSVHKKWTSDYMEIPEDAADYEVIWKNPKTESTTSFPFNCTKPSLVPSPSSKTPSNSSHAKVELPTVKYNSSTIKPISKPTDSYKPPTTLMGSPSRSVRSTGQMVPEFVQFKPQQPQQCQVPLPEIEVRCHCFCPAVCQEQKPPFPFQYRPQQPPPSQYPKRGNYQI